MRILLYLLVFFSPVSFAASQWDNVERIVAIGDVHGAYTQLVSLLRAGGLIDEKLAWSGGDTHLVSLGDLLDRGPESRKSMDLLMRLQQEAEAVDGYVHVLLGNHELMNLTGDLRDVSSAEHQALADLGGHASAFAMDGYYGRWLLERPVVIRINGTVFAHGGIPTLLSTADIESINKTANAALRTLLHEGARLRQNGTIESNTDLMIAATGLDDDQLALLGEDFIDATTTSVFSETGPLWYRGTASCHPLLETTPLSATLTSLGVQRAVVGHTPTPDREINERLNGRAYIIDTGMLASVYKGNARALELRENSIRAFSTTGEAPIKQLPAPDPLANLSQQAYQSSSITSGNTLVRFDNTDTIARFIKMSKREAKRALSAYRLDRHLGLHMVPAMVRRDIDGKHGIVIAWPNNPFTERRRVERSRARPNYCEQDSDFSLLAAFDALTGQRQRSVDNLYYARRTWQIRITDNHNTFGTSPRLPELATPPVLASSWANALANLDHETLQNLLGDLLTKKEISALLKRRDAILKWPRRTSARNMASQT